MSTDNIAASFVLLQRFNMMTLTMLMEPMRVANYLSPQPLYSWEFLTPGGGRVTASNGLPISCKDLDEVKSPSKLVLVCGSWGAEHYENQQLFRWLRKQIRMQVGVVGVELGVYAMARAGILSQHRVTTHWSMLAGLAEAFPQLSVVEQLYTIDGHMMSCAGGTAGLDLMLHLVERHHGDQLAAEVANQVLHHPRRPPESLQRHATGGKHDDVHPDVRAAMVLLEKRIEEPTPVPRVCREIGVSQRKLERLFKRDTGLTVVQYSKLLRLQYARVLLSTTRMSIREVSAACGFNSMSYFSQSFVGMFGKKPSEYRQAWPESEPAPTWPGTAYSFTQSHQGRKEKTTSK